MKTLTPEQTARLATLQTQHEANRAAWAKYAQPNYATKEQSAKIDLEAPFSNEQRAELETLLFLSTPAQKEFVYPSEAVTRAPKYAFAPGFDSLKLTGWMGNVLMSVETLGAEYRSNFGDMRRAVRAAGINGEFYCGTIYGTYCRMRPSKSFFAK